ncbi:MAG: hypothetical protein K1X89_12985 [Myxococcaceae bacterium]|nr:hypothetical protein [Myxococcaceae bacterium]
MILALLLAAAPMSVAGPPAPFTSPLGQALGSHFEGTGDTKVGDWVTFKLSSGGEREAYWRMAVVGEETDAKGRDAWWMEIEFGQHHEFKAPLAQVRVLSVKGQPLTAANVTRAYAAVGLDPVRELDARAIEGLFTAPPSAPPPANPEAAARDMGVRTVKGAETRLLTLAGTVSAVPVEVRIKSTVLKRFWVSRSVPVLHLAKIEIPAIGHSMEVRDFGTGAKGRMVLPPPGTPTLGVEHAEPTPSP